MNHGRYAGWGSATQRRIRVQRANDQRPQLRGNTVPGELAIDERERLGNRAADRLDEREPEFIEVRCTPSISSMTRNVWPRSKPTSCTESTLGSGGNSPRGWVRAAIAGAGIVAIVIAVVLATRSDAPATECGDTDRLLAARWSTAEAARVRQGLATMGSPGGAAAGQGIADTLDQDARSWSRLRDETCAVAISPPRQADAVMPSGRVVRDDGRVQIAGAPTQAVRGNAIFIRRFEVVVEGQDIGARATSV